MGAYLGAKNFFNISLEDVARKLGYSDENILILSGNEEELRRNYNDTYQNILSCDHHSDTRTPFKYAQDLVASWLIEDSFLDVFNRCGLYTSLDGADCTRHILSCSKTSTSSDYSVCYDNMTRKIELMNDYTGFWAKNRKLHLRDNKYKNLQKEHAILLAISMTTKEFALFDFKDEIKAKYIPSHRPYGYKPAYEISISDDMMYNATGENIVNEIIKHFDR